MSGSAKEVTVEDLSNKVLELTEIVKKQSKLITTTGQQVLDLQVKQTKQKFDSLDGGSVKSVRGTQIPKNFDDFVTNDDVVQLVGELQGQLDFLEARTIRRLVNSNLGLDSIVAPLPNTDGEEPPKEAFPKTLKDFENLKDEDLIELGNFYGLLPPSADEQKQMNDYLEGKVENLNLEKQLASATPPKVTDFKKDQLDDIYDELARYLGIKFRRNDAVW
ncbi:hypothetical protein PACTADRAFT_49276 [Pachysolen tannophilus NRRL Y-2460]|uniref:Mrp8p n=1 Tax=Pachysolen tannophilus NRRL Y-2460 TaxID=669874 RepID=A0A1E4TVS5_PACTA|nr:hypothetical protein PACTADRAFT_49276 [Pachysolen tannophilus NRRL Y-2460]